MTTTPDQHMIDHTLAVAAQSVCRSKRGASLYDMRTGAFRGAGFNGPPSSVCPGRAVCAGTCGQRSVHAEVRALREAAVHLRNGHPRGSYDLIHVELAANGGVVACAGPSCPGCAAQILDVGFVGGMWLYERAWVQVSSSTIDVGTSCPEPMGAHWRRYSAQEFYRLTLQRCGVPT